MSCHDAACLTEHWAANTPSIGWFPPSFHMQGVLTRGLSGSTPPNAARHSRDQRHLSDGLWEAQWLPAMLSVQTRVRGARAPLYSMQETHLWIELYSKHYLLPIRQTEIHSWKDTANGTKSWLCLQSPGLGGRKNARPPRPATLQSPVWTGFQQDAAAQPAERYSGPVTHYQMFRFELKLKKYWAYVLLRMFSS